VHGDQPGLWVEFADQRGVLVRRAPQQEAFTAAVQHVPAREVLDDGPGAAVDEPDVLRLGWRLFEEGSDQEAFAGKGDDRVAAPEAPPAFAGDAVDGLQTVVAAGAEEGFRALVQAGADLDGPAEQ
jgi:hypothetical protein